VHKTTVVLLLRYNLLSENGKAVDSLKKQRLWFKGYWLVVD